MYYGIALAVVGGLVALLWRNHRENSLERIVRVVPSVSERHRAIEQWILGRLGGLRGVEYVRPAPDADPKQLTQELMAVSGTESTAVHDALLAYLTEAVNISRLFLLAETRRAEAYDSNNPEHEKRLMHLWELYKPDVRLSNRISEEWTEIGFQGKDPATDFRGMGVLGLDHLIAFAEYHPEAARAVLSDCIKHKNWFSFAITSLNITADAFHFLKERKANTWFYRYGATMESFQRLHATLFASFNEAWKQANPPNVMSFKEIHDEWLADMELELARGTLQPLPRSVAEGIVVA